MKFQALNKLRSKAPDGIGELEKVECPLCDSDVIPYWEPKYKGYRAYCEACDLNWAES